MQDSPIAKLAALIHTLRSFGHLRVSIVKARAIARAMNEAIGGGAGHRSGSFWIYAVELNGAQLRLCVPADAAAAELNGAAVTLHAGRPVVAELEAVAPTSPRAAALAELRAGIAQIQAGISKVDRAAVALPTRRQLPAGESDLSWEVKVAVAARKRPEAGSEAWRVLRAS